jgi:hypothetical protein
MQEISKGAFGRLLFLSLAITRVVHRREPRGAFSAQ